MYLMYVYIILYKMLISSHYCSYRRQSDLISKKWNLWEIYYHTQLADEVMVRKFRYHFRNEFYTQFDFIKLVIAFHIFLNKYPFQQLVYGDIVVV